MCLFQFSFSIGVGNIDYEPLFAFNSVATILFEFTPKAEECFNISVLSIEACCGSGKHIDHYLEFINAAVWICFGYNNFSRTVSS